MVACTFVVCDKLKDSKQITQKNPDISHCRWTENLHLGHLPNNLCIYHINNMKDEKYIQ